MTAEYRNKVRCPNPRCGQVIDVEDPALHWIRTNPKLDSIRSGLTITDKDLIVHRYKTSHGREFQCFMSVEIKTMGASLSASQRDTLHIFNQFLRNRRNTPTKRRVFQLPGINEVYSPKNNRRVRIKAFGAHVLKLSGPNPDESDEIIWDKEFIDVPILIKIFRFDLDPDTLQEMDWRKHHVDPFADQMHLPQIA